MAQEDIEQKIILKYETNADEASQTVNNLTNNVDKTTDAQTKSAKASKIQGDAIKELAPAATSAVNSLKTMGKAMWAIVANPLGLILAAIAVTLGVLFLAFKSFQPLVDKVEQSFAALGAVVNVIKNTFVAVVTGTKSLGDAFGGLSGDMDEAATRTMALVKAQQDLEDSMARQTVQSARNRVEINKLNVELKNRALTEEQRLKIADRLESVTKQDFEQRKKEADKVVRLAREAIAIKAKFTDEEIALLKKTDLATKDLAESRGGSYDEEYKALEAAILARTSLTDESTSDLERIYNKRDKLEDDKLAKQEKAAADATARGEKAAAAREKEAARVTAENEKAIAEKQAYLAKANAADDEAFNLKLEKEKAEKDRKQKEYDDGLAAQAEKAKNESDVANNLAEEQKRRDQALVDQKAKNKDDILATGDALIEGARMLAGKNKQLQKAAIIAEGAMALGKVGVNIATGVSKDAASGAVASIPQIIKTLATGAVSTAAIISNTARALKAVGGGGSGLSEGGRGQSAGASATPQVNFQGSKENQIGNTLAGKLNEQAPVKVVILENEMTKKQDEVKAKVVSNSF